jgi:hypothetical protein
VKCGAAEATAAEGTGMAGSLRWMLLALCMFTGAAAHAGTVVGTSVNCRAAARTTSPVLGVLQRGAEVQVLSSSGAWSYVDPDLLPACWIRSDLLSSSVASYGSVSRSYMNRAHVSSRQNHSVRPKTRYAASRARRPLSGGSRRKARSLYDAGSSCPCRGSNICIGPRGGRYCITSGGNKRYGV